MRFTCLQRAQIAELFAGLCPLLYTVEVRRVASWSQWSERMASCFQGIPFNAKHSIWETNFSQNHNVLLAFCLNIIWQQLLTSISRNVKAVIFFLVNCLIPLQYLSLISVFIHVRWHYPIMFILLPPPQLADSPLTLYLLWLLGLEVLEARGTWGVWTEP